MPLGIRNNHGLKYGVNHGVAELLIHLPPSGFGFAQIAQPHGHAIDLSGNGPQVVARAPLDPMRQVAAANLPRRLRRAAQRQNQRSHHQSRDQNGQKNRNSAGRNHLIHQRAEVLLNAHQVAVAQILQPHAGQRRVP